MAHPLEEYVDPACLSASAARRLDRVLDAVATAFHDDVPRVRDFLVRRHPLLDGESPLEVTLSSSTGADAVLNLVRQAEAGVAV